MVWMEWAAARHHTEVKVGEIVSVDVKTDLMHRLRRIEGQTRGVQRMLEEGRDCKDILQQLSAIRSAANKASLLLVRSYATQCMHEIDPSRSPSELVDELVSVLARVA